MEREWCLSSGQYSRVYIIVVAVHSQDNMRLACANAVLAVYCNYFVGNFDMYDIQQCNTNYRVLYKHFIINPRCACARELQYLLTLGVHAREGYSTCFVRVPVCLSVCLSVCYCSSGGSFHSNAQTKVRTALIQYSLDL